MDDQTNRSYRNLIDPVLRSYVHERSTVDTLEGNREDLIKAGDSPQGAFLLELNGGVGEITKVLCLVSLRLLLKHQRLSNRWNSDLLGLIESCFHGSPSSCWMVSKGCVWLLTDQTIVVASLVLVNRQRGCWVALHVTTEARKYRS
jgi:hypothetical protein